VLIDAIEDFTVQLRGKVVNRFLPIPKRKIPRQSHRRKDLQDKGKN
jgi:hypothetical protein